MHYAGTEDQPQGMGGDGTKWVCHLLSGDCTPALRVLQWHHVESASAKQRSAMFMMMYPYDNNPDWAHDDLPKDYDG